LAFSVCLWYFKKMQTPSLEVRDLEKRFHPDSPPAVFDLNFSLYPGESVAFLGPNGAGKSTTIKMLCGVITPSKGQALIGGLPAGTQKANQLLGLVFGTRSQLYLHMTVYQCFDLIAEIYFVTGQTKKSRIQALCDVFHIEHLLDKRVRTLSLGQRMRCELIVSLLHHPKVLLLDEPTIGLDMVAKNQLRDLIGEWQKKEQTTFMLTSHDLMDVETLCERCILIDHGVKRFDGTLQQLKGDLAWIRRILITTKKSHLTPLPVKPYLQLMSDATSEFTHQYEVMTQHYPMAAALADLSSHYGLDLQDINIAEISLEEVLAKMYERKKP
jgi:ABC-2 type transport system ATP-binding protein